MKKRILSAFLALAIALILTSCGSQSAPMQQSTAPSSGSTQDTTAPDTEISRGEISDANIKDFNHLEQFGADMFYAADTGSIHTGVSGWAQSGSLSAERGLGNISVGTKNGRFDQLNSGGKIYSGD